MRKKRETRLKKIRESGEPTQRMKRKDTIIVLDIFLFLPFICAVQTIAGTNNICVQRFPERHNDA